MGFFSKIKEKFNKQVDKVTESVQTKVSEAVKATTEAVKSSTEVFKFNKVKDGMKKTRKSFLDKIARTLGIGKKIDDALLSELEDALISADIGVVTTDKIIEELRIRIKKAGYENSEDVFKLLKEIIYDIMIQSPSAENDKLYQIDENKRPHTILVVGVNGVGKTTTIGKLAYNYKNAGQDVIIGAADTFRAAANEQLEIWAERAGVEIIQRGHGADPASVTFDTLQSAISKKKDVTIIDTAGRLHNKTHLMQELEKIGRVMKKLKADAPDDVYLVLDATTGQNAILQAKEFMKVARITGIVLTKLDGTAKGGVVIAIASELKIPVRYIGVGEKIDDLQPFDSSYFVEALFEISDMEEED